MKATMCRESMTLYHIIHRIDAVLYGVLECVSMVERPFELNIAVFIFDVIKSSVLCLVFVFGQLIK